MSELKYVGSSPHLRSSNSTIARQVEMFIALLVLAGWGVYALGLNALIVVASSMLSALVIEMVFNLFKFKRFVLDEISSLIVGLAIGLSLPANLPFYFAIAGSVLSVLLIKLVCGGLGKNFVSEVAFGKLLIAIMLGSAFWSFYSLEGAQTLTELTHAGVSAEVSTMDILFGNVVGAIGETNIVLIVVLGVFLSITKAIDWKIPFFYLTTLLICGLFVVDVELYLQFVASGGIVFVAFFVATDSGSAPNTAIGKILFGAVCGGLTCLIWRFGNYMLAPYFAVLISEIIFSAFSENFKPRFAGFYKEKR